MNNYGGFLRSKKLPKHFAKAKYFTFAERQIFHTAKPYLTRRSRISPENAIAFSSVPTTVPL